MNGVYLVFVVVDDGYVLQSVQCFFVLWWCFVVGYGLDDDWFGVGLLLVYDWCGIGDLCFFLVDVVCLDDDFLVVVFCQVVVQFVVLELIEVGVIGSFVGKDVEFWFVCEYGCVGLVDEYVWVDGDERGCEDCFFDEIGEVGGFVVVMVQLVWYEWCQDFCIEYQDVDYCYEWEDEDDEQYVEE